MFDEDPGSVSAGQPHKVMKSAPQKEFVPQMEQFGIYVPGAIGGYFRDVCAWKQYALELIGETRRRDVHTPFLKAALSAGKDASGHQLNDSQLAEECMGGMFGGSGTTANTFVYILWACLQRPGIIANLKSELREKYPGPGMVPDYKTTVGTQNYTMHRNEEAFPNAEDFLPERWLDANKDSLRKSSWTPFSMGSRKCIGI
ncbi:hypothetical protein N0V84_012495, partial [Fusarium piperis]